MTDEKFGKILKENRPTPQSKRIAFKQIYDKAKNREVNPFPLRNVFASLAVVVAIFSTFFISENKQNTSNEIEMAKFLEETFSSSYVNDYDSGDDFLSLVE